MWQRLEPVNDNTSKKAITKTLNGVINNLEYLKDGLWEIRALLLQSALGNLGNDSDDETNGSKGSGKGKGKSNRNMGGIGVGKGK